MTGLPRCVLQSTLAIDLKNATRASIKIEELSLWLYNTLKLSSLNYGQEY